MQRFSVAAVGESVHLTIEDAYEGIEQPIASFQVVLNPESAAQLHRDLSKAAERARMYPQRAKAERLRRQMDSVFSTVMALSTWEKERTDAY